MVARRIIRSVRRFSKSRSGKRLKRFARVAVLPVVARYAPRMAYAYGMRALSRNVAREQAASSAAYFRGTRERLVRMRSGSWNGS